MPAVHTHRGIPRDAESERVHGALVLSRSSSSRLVTSPSRVGFLLPSQRVSVPLAREARANMYTLVSSDFRCPISTFELGRAFCSVSVIHNVV